MNAVATRPSHYFDWSSPLGDLRLLRADAELCAIWFRDGKHCRDPQAGWKEGVSGFEAVIDQLEEYFTGERTAFDFPHRAEGTPFQKAVWNRLQRIPPGDTMSYGELASDLGRPRAVRAVAAANARNPLSIVIPCHRVIGSDGRLTGYAGGLARKRRLLDLEGAAYRAESTSE